MKRRPGRPLAKGRCATREELEQKLRWYRQYTTLSIEAIARRLGVSHQTATIVLKAQP